MLGQAKSTNTANGHTHEDRSSPLIVQDGSLPTIFVGIAGGTASGKTTVCEEIFARVRVGDYKQSTLIPLDAFYKECTEE